MRHIFATHVFARSAALAALALLPFKASALDLPGLPDPAQATIAAPALAEVPSAEITASVAALLGNPPGLEFRKLQRLSAESGAEALYCGQVLAGAGGRHREFQLFTYARLSGTGAARILGSHDLNGMKSGRETIAWLKRAGCL